MAKKAKVSCCVEECPKAGDIYVCDSCKHTIEVVRDCACDDCECVAYACCGVAMCKVN